MPRGSFLYIVSISLLLISCTNEPKSIAPETATPDSLTVLQPAPDWAYRSVIYEVNLRQYTKEGTLKAFSKHLDRLKKMGVNTLLFMPLQPVGKSNMRGTMGSYYALSDFNTFNPDFGTMAEWKALVNKAHAMGFRIIQEWMGYHTSTDHPWIKQYPDFYHKDSLTGKPEIPFDWDDVRKLNYENPQLCDSMITSMAYWLKETGIDGYHVDMVWDIDSSFWNKLLPRLREIKEDIFLIGEADGIHVLRYGFNASYPWALYQQMLKVSSGKANALLLDSLITYQKEHYPFNALLLQFTSNHDENAWANADSATMPGARFYPFTVLTFTISKALPLIYCGQEEPLIHPLKFFDKDVIPFRNYARTTFYQKLSFLRSSRAALRADAHMQKVGCGNPEAIIAYVRELEGQKMLVILNLSNTEQTITITDKSLHGTPLNTFMGVKEPVTDKPWKMEPWGYVIYEY